MRACCLWLLLALVGACLPACSGNEPPATLSPDEEKQMQQQLETDRQAEGAAQQEGP